MKPFDIDFKLDCKKEADYGLMFLPLNPIFTVIKMSLLHVYDPFPFSALKGTWFYFLSFSVYVECRYIYLEQYIDVRV